MPKRYLLIAAAVFFLDRLTKWLVVRRIPLYDSLPVIPGFFRITHLENPGAAFSLFADSPSPLKTTLLILFSVASLTVVAILLWRNRTAVGATNVALALVLGGAAGNLVDRVTSGRVVDFLDFYSGQHHWYPFNIGDSAVLIGALLLFVKSFIRGNTAGDTSRHSS